ncbi:hypothetical protein KCP75_24725 [Salmonella enterica subsp. enterica]|nr:hypothetical protein KCP75_24725 [Salmonella enterica subsp. enterica]
MAKTSLSTCYAAPGPAVEFGALVWSGIFTRLDRYATSFCCRTQYGNRGDTVRTTDIGGFPIWQHDPKFHEFADLLVPASLAR